MRLTIRDGGSVDAETLLEIQRAASAAGLGHIFPPALHPFPAEEVLERWRSFGGRVLLAEDGSNGIGLAALEDCWLQGLYVLPNFWGEGVAPRLHDAALAGLRDAGCTEARLWVLEHNERARRFYERRGWRLNEGRRVVPFPPNPVDVSYTLDLAGV